MSRLTADQVFTRVLLAMAISDEDILFLHRGQSAGNGCEMRRIAIPLMLLCLATPLRAEPTREELKREAEELRKMGERAEKKTPPAKKGNGR